MMKMKNLYSGDAGKVGYKEITVTGKRQITIPKSFFDHLGFGTTVAAYLKDGGIFLEPLKEDAANIIDFDTREIVRQAMAEGLAGDELADEISRRIAKLNKLMDRRIQEFERDLLSDSVEDSEEDDCNGLDV